MAGCFKISIQGVNIINWNKDGKDTKERALMVSVPQSCMDWKATSCRGDGNHKHLSMEP